MKCNHCNSEVADGTKFCPYCGNRIELPISLRCPQCNTEVADGTKFCPNCGSPMAFQQQPQQGQYQQPYQGQYQQQYQGYNQQQYRQRPRLGFLEAIKLASQRLTEIDGRSRRSEFWWWTLLIFLCGILIGIPYVGSFVALAQAFLMHAVFSRRLHDCSAPNWLYNIVLYCVWLTALFTFINGFAVDGVHLAKDIIKIFGKQSFNSMSFGFFCWCLVGFVYAIKDGKPETDPKYGPSPKYY